MKKQLPVGYDSFKKLISENLYYVDKTLIIKDILDRKSQVNLFTRPRRFGKTLTLSMLQTFFENTKDNRDFFEGLKIMDAGEEYISHMGKYPVIRLSLKSAKQPSFKMAYDSILDEIAKEFKRYAEILESSKLLDSEKKQYYRIMEKTAGDIEYAKALEYLSSCLTKVYEQDTIILIDEYDVPLENAYFTGFYQEMIGFLRSLFESALKTNENLKLAVVTGCLRISRESIFTGLNNLEIHSVMDQDYAEHFGFIPSEVRQMLEYYQLQGKRDELKEWYDGYLFGRTEVYNPWSVINYIKTAKAGGMAYPKPYWSNTSSNSIVRELVERADSTVKQEIENLLVGEAIEKFVQEDITYEDIYKTQDNLWSFLFFTGYLKKVGECFREDKIYLKMAIPNLEVRYIYRNTIMEWFQNKVDQTDFQELSQAIQTKQSSLMEEIITGQLVETISFYDYAENYYHGFLCGLLKACKGFVILSNRESGNGRPDIIMKTPSVRGMAVIMEIKVVKNFGAMESGCKDALKQIEDQDYAAELKREGYGRIIKYGMCFYRKECMVKAGID